MPVWWMSQLDVILASRDNSGDKETSQMAIASLASGQAHTKGNRETSTNGNVK